MHNLYRCHSGHKMRMDKSQFGDHTLRCTGKVNKRMNGKIVFDQAGKPEKVNCRYAKSWGKVDPNYKA